MKHPYLLIFIVGLTLSVAIAQAQHPEPMASTTYYRGVDLSYVNEMDDCGAEYRVDGEARDPYQIFADFGANLARIRLWHNPTWTEYSTFDDVVRSLQRANDAGMNVLLDFHYSDTWADPSKQIIPAAWEAIADTDALAYALYQYTYETLTELDSLGLMPEIVQVGNEINTEILRPEGASGYPINWERNAQLLNSAIQAVRDAGAQSNEAPQVMLHVAKPEDVEGWLLAATRADVTDFDIVGISYYPGWSNHSIETVGSIIGQLHYKFNKEVIIAETAYLWTLGGVAESASNIMGSDFVEEGYPATPAGQRQFLIDLMQSVLNNGGLGIVYWEPAWVSTPCHTLWGQGSHWENGTFFDFNDENEVLPGIEFLEYAYDYPVDVWLRFQFDAADHAPEQIYFWGDFTGMGRRLLRVENTNGEYIVHTRLLPGTLIQYQFYSDTPASAETALLPPECLNSEGYMEMIIPDSDSYFHQTDTACAVLRQPIPTPHETAHDE